ncbi:cellulase family glycosylhydrolase [Dactylosporangium sp. NPDC000555]|uniref:cellulase family glycosylhydrolase n=1 Tax=Dactylosporangium sp. NPDC000555 TaxID=3154260 RepID=UPI003317AA35
MRTDAQASLRPRPGRPKALLVVATLLAGLGVLSTPARAHAAEPHIGIRVRDGRLVEADGSDLVLRGINHDFMWYPNKNDAFAAIKATGANAVRVTLGIGHQWRRATGPEVSTVIDLCQKNRLICIFDAHDTAGFGQDKKAAPMAEAVRFWLSLRDRMVGHEDYVLVNIADEPFANGTTWPWAQQTADAIRRLRAAGFKHTLLVDGPGWGQDESFVMRDSAERIVAADPTGNTVFDIHMYGMFNTAAKVNSYLTSYTKRRLPIVIGEFSSQHEWGKPDEDAIMAYAQAQHLGFLGWSWSGNDKQYSYLDLVNNFDGNSRTAWGQRFINGPNGLRTDTREATVFRNGTADAVADRSDGAPRGLTVTDVTSNSVRLAWQPRPSRIGGTTYQVVAVNGAAETRVATTNHPGVTLERLRGSTEYTYAVYAQNMLGKRSPRSALVVAITPPAR